MTRLGGAWRRWADALRATPLHPQWLLGPREPPSGLRHLRGVVLDVGAADRWIQPALHASVHYIALDHPGTATQRYGTRPDVFADAARLPLASASVDAVVCLETLEHVADFEQALAEIARVLKPEGRVFLSMPFLYPIHDAPFDHTRLTEHGWELQLRRAGLRAISLSPRGTALDVAGVAACLALAAPLVGRPMPLAALMAALALPLILAVNLSVALARRVWPSWRGQCLGYSIEAARA